MTDTHGEETEMVQSIKCLKFALLYLLWPFAAFYDLMRDRTYEKIGWRVAVVVGGVVLFFLGEAIFVSSPSLWRTTLITVLTVLYLGFGNEFRVSAKEQNLWEL